MSDALNQVTSYDSVENTLLHSYSCDNRNRLNNLGVATGSANLFGYNYTVDAAGYPTQEVSPVGFAQLILEAGWTYSGNIK